MASATWPSSLPQTPLTDGYGESQQPNKIRTPMEIGPAKQRKRYTKDVDKIDATFEMDDSQVETFLDFYENTISAGVDKFDIDHPRTGNTVEARFRTGGGDDYTIANVGANIYQVTTKLEIV